MFTVCLSPSFSTYAKAKSDKRNAVTAGASEHVKAATAEPGRRVRKLADGAKVNIDRKLDLLTLRHHRGAIRTMPGAACLFGPEFYGDDYVAL